MKAKKKYIDIRVKLLGLAIIPVILVALILGYYLIKTRIDDVHASLIKKGELITKNFAPAVEFGLFTQNTELLNLLSQPILLDTEVISVSIFDQNENIILNTYSKNYSENFVEWNDDEISTFRSSVISTRLISDEFGEAVQDENSRVMGWVEVKMSHQALNQREMEIIETSILLLVAALLVCIFVAIRIGVRVSNPILSLTKMVGAIGQGNLEIRAEENASGELGSLQIGINAMAETIQASHGRMQDEIEVSTIALRHTVKALEEKNTELESAKFELEEAVKAKSDFLAKMSHEIRTPLNAVIGFTRLVEKSSNKREQEEYTRTIKHAGSQLLTVIDDILSFSKLEEADVQFQHTPFDLRDSLEDMLSMFSPLARAKELQLILLIDLDVPGVLIGDSLRINQVLSNLINNALKFTSSGTVTIRVSLKYEAEDHIVRFVVSDTGIGIEPEKKKLLFKAFSQIDTNLSRQYEGAGLGLAISKRIIELMDGCIGVDSTSQRGSNFWFEIPCEVGYEEKEAAAKYLTGYNALLYDRSPTSRLSIRNHFLSWQVNLYLAKNSQELYERIADETLTFDFVVISLGYENSSREEVESLLQEVNKKFSKKVLLLVCSNYRNLKKLFSERQDILVLEKPIRKHKLRERAVEFFDMNASSARMDNVVSHFVDARKVGHELPVLVAEDNEFNSILISAMLEERGFQVTCRSNGKEILNLLPEKKFVLFFIDIHMPDMDGYELALKCRREKLIADDVPVIAFTADIMLKQIDSLSDYGFSDVLYKPISNESLDRLLAKWVKSDEKNDCKLNVIDTVDMRQRLYDDIKSRIGYLKQYVDQLNSEKYHEQIHQLEGLLGYYQLTSLLFILKEIKHAVIERDSNELALKITQLESELGMLELKQQELSESAALHAQARES